MKIYQREARRNSSTISQISFAVLLLIMCALATRAQTNTFPSSGNTGIGTTSPNAPLNVISASGNDQALAQKWGYTSSSNDAFNLILKQVVSSGLVKWTFDQVNNSTTYADVFTLDRGSVGIGTSAPGAKLHIFDSAQQTAFKTTTKGSLNLQSTTATNDYTALTFQSSSSYPGAKIAYKQTSSGGVLQFGTSNDYSAGINNEAMTIDPGGNVGIGTTSPGRLLSVVSASSDSLLQMSRASNAFLASLELKTSTTQDWLVGTRDTTNSDFHLYSFGTAADAMTVLRSNGNVGIGTPTPGYKLDVNGTINSSSTITANNIVAKFQDLAEWVPSSQKLSAGTVVVLDSTKSNQVTSSSVSYDTRVAGVVSEQPGIALGENSEGKVLVATTGRVRVKVDASKGAIHIGDLLVTSDIPGAAMKSEPVNLGGVQLHRPGTLIGKALEPLEKGSGAILVLLSLQ